MQTFLPYKSFRKTALCLDNKRLGKQRVETLQILRALTGYYNQSGAWLNHPAVKMWRGYEANLVDYGLEICQEWGKRGFADSCYDKIASFNALFVKKSEPPFLGCQRFHDSHKSNLLRKNSHYYGQFTWHVSKNLPYFWPVASYLTSLDFSYIILTLI